MMTHRLTSEPMSRPRHLPDASLASVRSWPSEAAKSWTLHAIRHSKRDARIQAIVASGSAVREVEQSDDLDLLIVHRTGRPKLPSPSIDVDLRFYEEAQLLRGLERGHDYLLWTVRCGRVLFERDGWWTRLTADWRHRLPLPSADEARERADKARRIRDDLLEIGDHDAAAEVRVSMLTCLARAALSTAGVYPNSRPELADQLRGIDKHDLADRLSDALTHRYG